MDAMLPINEKEPPKIPSGPLVVIAFILFLVVGIAGTTHYLYTNQPDMVKHIALKLDRLGLTQPNPTEINRVSEINILPISYEEKQILINKTIFLGATPRMVMLALGKPKEGHRANSEIDNAKTLILVYHLPEDLRPTMLYFEEGKLTQARKGSSIDFDTTPVPYTGTNSE